MILAGRRINDRMGAYVAETVVKLHAPEASRMLLMTGRVPTALACANMQQEDVRG